MKTSQHSHKMFFNGHQWLQNKKGNPQIFLSNYDKVIKAIFKEIASCLRNGDQQHLEMALSYTECIHNQHLLHGDYILNYLWSNIHK